jgi:hypothetical protein
MKSPGDEITVAYIAYGRQFTVQLYITGRDVE